MNSKVREETRRYHNKFYQKAELFKEGSWLEKPEELIVNLVIENFRKKRDVRILDLGCGVGRNAIPLAEIIGKNNGKIVCVDYLKTAIDKLREYAKTYEVDKYIISHVLDVGDFTINKNTFDFIIAHSVLSHLRSKTVMKNVIKDMISGTKKGGYNHIGLVTELEEVELGTKRRLKPNIEIWLSEKEAEDLLRKYYKHWKILTLKPIPYEEICERNGKKVLWKCSFLFFIARHGQ
jgi:SAM-dependent methyltransferase